MLGIEGWEWASPQQTELCHNECCLLHYTHSRIDSSQAGPQGPAYPAPQISGQGHGYHN